MTALLNRPVAPCHKTLTSYLEQINDRGGLFTDKEEVNDE